MEKESVTSPGVLLHPLTVLASFCMVFFVFSMPLMYHFEYVVALIVGIPILKLLWRNFSSLRSAMADVSLEDENKKVD